MPDAVTNYISLSMDHILVVSPTLTYTSLLLMVLFLINLMNEIQAENILMVTMGGTRSHTIPFVALAKELSLNEHNVTLLSGFPGATSGTDIEEITPLDFMDYIHRSSLNWKLIERRFKGQNPFSLLQIIDFAVESCHILLHDPLIGQFLQLKNRRYDLVILDGAYSACSLGFAHHFQAPFMFLNTVAMYTAPLAAAGNPEPYAITPFMNTAYTEDMGFLARLHNLGMHFTAQVLHLFIVCFFIQPELYTIFGEDMPNVLTMQRDVSFILQNGHATLTYPRAILPNVAEIACIHCHPATQLPQELEEWVAGSEPHGVVVVSMGSSVHTGPNRLSQMFLQAFSRLSQRVIWKWELQANVTIPSNVKILHSIPQQDLLGHPNVVAFVSHGGLLSMFEAVYHAKPMIILPVFCDHDTNAAKAMYDGYALRLELHGLTSDTLHSAIEHVIYDTRYQKSVEFRSRLFRDQPETPLKRAVFWTQHVIRHGGAKHLQGYSRYLGLVQWLYIDVLSVLITLSLLGVLIVKKCARYRNLFTAYKLKTQ